MIHLVPHPRKMNFSSGNELRKLLGSSYDLGGSIIVYCLSWGVDSQGLSLNNHE